MREGWEYKKIKDVAEVFAGQGAPQGDSNYCSNGIPFIKAGNLFELINGKNEASIQNVSEQVALSHKLRLYKAGSVLFAKSGMSCMKGYVYTLKNDCYVVSHLAIITPHSVNSHFLNYYLCVNKPNSLIKDAAYPSISLKDIENLKIPIPPLAEQERIVAELDLLSSIIDKKKAQLKELDQLAQSIFYTMFGDPITNEKGWEVIQLGSKCEVSSFKRVLIEDVVDEGVPFIRGTELMTLSKGEKTSFTLFITQEHYEKVKNISGVPKIGDLLIPSINANGCIWILDTEEPRYYKDGRVLWVHVDEKSYSSQALKFIMHSLIKNTYSSVASGATFAELKLFVLRELNTILPPLSLQQEFAEKVEAIERQKALVQQSIAETQTLFDSRMDHWFS